jgi:outer membrane protein OmpA-like peptidoglycan-associated protein
MRAVVPFIPCLLLLSSCNTPPMPPTVDESMKRPANSQIAVELQVCKNDLQNTRILAAESGRLAETATATLANVAARQQVLGAMHASAAATPRPNSVHTVHFGFGSTRVVIPADFASALLAEAKVAPLVLLRGRTDGATDTSAESRIARERAAAVRDYLVAAGVDAARIRTTYQPAGDQVADNTDPAGRSQNRRVEIEVYRAQPVVLSSSTAVQP